MALFEDFKKWLETNIPKSTKHYITGYNTINKLIEEYGLTLFNNLDINNIDDFIQNISEIDAYKKMNIKGSNMYSATLTNYKKFLMDQNLSIPIIEKPFEEFGWRWATTGIASYLNDSKYLKTVLDAILINGNGLLNQTSDFKNLVEAIGINKYKIESSKIDQISKKSNPSDSKNIIENSANYWYHLGLLESTGQNAKVSELGYNFLVGKLSNLEFVDHIINNYLIPSPIYKKNEIALFEQFDIKFKPLKIIVDILLYLEKFDKEQAFLTENDLKNLIVPFSIKYTEENIEIFSSHLINFRNNPSLYNTLPDCTSQYTDDKGLRMLNEFLYFLECFEVLESNSTNVRNSEKKYNLNHNYKVTIPDTLVSTELIVIVEGNLNKEISFNKIYFGPPGTGKSHAIKEELKKLGAKGDNYSRVTFHPDYDYHSFVGGYKPFTDTEDDDKIKYKFVPQVFTDLYVKAWSNTSEDYYLVIEEINRGNCAEIFGDIFQLLDRNPEYNIEPSSELKAYLKEQENDLNKDKTEEDAKVNLLFDGKLQMPNNLSILASMNTSDQSLYPMDSAFKRRWDWHYVPIDLKCTESNFTIKIDDTHQYSWLEFLAKVNDKIYSVTKSEDKQIGNWFINASKSENIISKELFINKVLFYLWNDVFKDEVFNPDNIFIERNTDGAKNRDISFNNFYNKEEQDRLLIHLLSTILNVPLLVSEVKETIQYSQDNSEAKIAAEPNEEYKDDNSESEE